VCNTFISFYGVLNFEVFFVLLNNLWWDLQVKL